LIRDVNIALHKTRLKLLVAVSGEIGDATVGARIARSNFNSVNGAKSSPRAYRACRRRVVPWYGDVSGSALPARCAERVPETIDLTVEPPPRNANGKVMKKQLREAWAAGQA
jgi:hypothetical protein